MDLDHIEEQLSEFIAGLHFEALPTELVMDMKYRLLDWIGCALAGLTRPTAQKICDFVVANGGAPQATLFGSAEKVPAAQAALANGVMGHLVEFDDGHRQAIAHPGSVAIPTALAVGEQVGATGREVITAVVAGYEVMIRLGAAINPSHYRIWHTTGTCGVFAAAATAAVLLNLNPKEVRMALGIAGTLASGLQETFGTDAKPLNAGHACCSGIQAAFLARSGFTGPQHIISGKKGFVAAMTESYDPTPLTTIGQGKFLASTAFYKMFSSCGHTHSPLSAVFTLIRRCPPEPADIRRIRVRTYRTSVELTGRLATESEEAAKFSLPYCIAVAILYHRVTLSEFTSKQLKNPQVLRLAEKVEVIEDSEASSLFPQRLAQVQIELANGTVLEEKVTGADDTPNYLAIVEKYLALAALTISEPLEQDIENFLLQMDHKVSLDDLFQLLSNPSLIKKGRNK